MKKPKTASARRKFRIIFIWRATPLLWSDLNSLKATWWVLWKPCVITAFYSMFSWLSGGAVTWVTWNLSSFSIEESETSIFIFPWKSSWRMIDPARMAFLGGYTPSHQVRWWLGQKALKNVYILPYFEQISPLEGSIWERGETSAKREKKRERKRISEKNCNNCFTMYIHAA